MKKSESDTKQKVMRLFESKVDNNTSMNYKPKKIKDAFEDKYVEYKSEKDKTSSMEEYLEKTRQHLRDTIDDHKKPVSGKYIW